MVAKPKAFSADIGKDRTMGTRLLTTAGAACTTLALITTLAPTPAEACGCFVPPDPTVPIVQAGERILFAVDNGVVTSHVQIQYAGDAKDFGWLLPLPSVPTLELGTDELFTQLYNTTQPRYYLTVQRDGNCSDNPQGR